MASEIRLFDPGDSILKSETKIDALYELSARMAEAQAQANIDNPSNPLSFVTESQTNENNQLTQVYNFVFPARETLNDDQTDTVLKPRPQLGEYLPWEVTTGDLAGTTSAEEALDRLAKQVNIFEKKIPDTNTLNTPNTITRDPQPEQGQLIIGINVGLNRTFDDTTGKPMYETIDHLLILDTLIDSGAIQV
jgi:hypothetical protein